MKFYVFKLLPPRASFMVDITAEERSLMQAHSLYWRGQMALGKIVVFGPVADPSGPYGLGVIRLDDAEDPKPLVQNDPVILANAGFSFTLAAMPSAVLPG